jgi:NADPH2:quinone reductase
MASQVTSMMRAAVMHEIGGPEVLKVIQWPIPKPKAGEVLIRVKAYVSSSIQVIRQTYRYVTAI